MKTRINKNSARYRWLRHAGCFGMVGSGIQAVAAAQAQQGMDAAVQHEIQKQAKYRTRGMDEFYKSLAQSGVSDAGTAVGRGAGRTLAESQRLSRVPTTQSARGVTSSSGGKATGAWADLLGAMSAPATGYNEFTLQQMIKNLRASQALQNIGIESQASREVAPLEVESAKNKWAFLNTVGQVIGGGGNSGLAML